VTPDEFRRVGHEIVDLIADYRRHVVDRPVMAQTAPGEIKANRSTSSWVTSAKSSSPALLTGNIHAFSATSRVTARSQACSVIM
jgi:hypothetical protein